MPSIDLNCDLGEGCGNDAQLMPLITSANIACGFHAGDADSIKRTIDLAIEHGVAIGVHPGYRDRENFGRIDLDLPYEEIGQIVSQQIEILKNLCDKAGAEIRHVKPHGALYNRSARDPSIARAIAESVKKHDEDLVLFGLSGSHSIAEAERVGLRTASEVFADRTYQSDGSLTPRTDPRALIHDEDTAVLQVLDMVKYGRVRSIDGIMAAISAETLCIHGDGPTAVKIASSIRHELLENGVMIKPKYG